MNQDQIAQPVKKNGFFTSVFIKIKQSPFKALAILASVILLLLGIFTFLLIIYFVIFPEMSEKDIISRIRSDIAPAVVQIRCLDEDGRENAVGTGLYYLETGTNKAMVETNAHVVLDKAGNFNGCNVYFPRPVDGTFYEATYRADYVYKYNKKISGLSTSTYIYGIDYALLELSQFASTTYPFPPDKVDPYIALDEMCKNSGYPDIKIGDKLYLLGYPETGYDSLTITEGILSGFTGVDNEWLKISASSNHGNSGGIVIGATNGCNYGILTRATFLKGSNLGYALSSGYIRDFLENITDVEPYALPSVGDSPSAFLTEKYTISDIVFKYPKNWMHATSSNKYSADMDLIEIYAPNTDATKDYVSGAYIYRLPNSTEQKKSALIGKFTKTVKDLGAKEYTSRSFTRNGILVNEVSYVDDTLDVYSVPVYIRNTIFNYKGILYLFIADYEKGTDSDKYSHIYDSVINSIIFN
jgi:hypothetical protein